MQGVNLIPAGRLQASRRRRRIRWWTVVCTAYIFVLLITYLGCQLRWNGGRDDHAGRMRRIIAQIGVYNCRIAATKETIAVVQVRIDANTAVGNQPDWSVLLALLAKDLGKDVVLRHCKLDLAADRAVGAVECGHGGRGRFVFALSGLGRTQTAVSQFVLRLEKAGLFDRVELIKTNRESFLSGRAVAFQLACSLGGDGGKTR